MRHVFTAVVVSLLVAAPALAQTAPPSPPTPVAAPPPSQPAPSAPPPAAPYYYRGQNTAPPPAQKPGSAPTPPATNTPPRADAFLHGSNIKIELTISESGSAATMAKKTVVLTTMTGRRASLRSSVNRGEGVPSLTLSVDASPEAQVDGRIFLTLGVVYSPDSAASDNTRPADLNESLTVFVADGKPLVISQSADPKGDRKVTVEVTATILK
jgi:hypothetical protein